MSGDQVNPFQSPQTLNTLMKGVRFKSGHAMAICAMVMLAIVMVAEAVLAGLIYQSILLLQQYQMGHVIPRAEALGSDLRQSAAALFQLVASFGSAICFLTWFYRAHRNLRALGNRHLYYTSFSAIWWWFIPIANWICPCLVMAEVWKGSDPKNARSSYTIGKLSPLVMFWWGLFVLMGLWGLAGYLIGVTSQGARPLDTIITIRWLVFQRSLIALPGAVLAILLVRAVDANQQKRYELIEEQSALPPPPVATAVQDDFPFVPPAGPLTWTPPDDAGQYPRFG